MPRFPRIFLLGLALLALVATQALAGDPIQITTSPADDMHPSWTADGQHLVFESKRSGTWHLYRVPVAGGTVEQLTFGTLHDRHPEVSPDGTTIAFTRQTYTPIGNGFYLEEGNIWSIPVTGGTMSELTPFNPLDLDGYPTWSPTGSTIYYRHRIGGDNKIWRVPAGGGDGEPFFDVGMEDQPHVSPDGLKVALEFDTGSAHNIIEVSTLNPADWSQLTFETQNTSPNDYSADGERLLYVSRRADGWLELFELELATGISTQLTFDGTLSGQDPGTHMASYSPDGSRVAFHSRRVTGEYNIWVLDLSTPPAENLLAMGDGRSLPGFDNNRVGVELQNTVAVPALEFKLADLPDHLEILRVRPVGRARGMDVSFVDGGQAHVLLYSSGGASIAPGTGDILEMKVGVDSGAPLGTVVDVTPFEVVMSDPAGAAVPVLTQPGVFLIERKAGDVNGDNLVDVGDLVRLVEIILGTGNPPSPEELAAADINDDGDVNALDVTYLQQIILGGSSAPAIFALGAMESPAEWVIRTESEVRGLQFFLPSASEGVVCPEAGGMEFRCGRIAGGDRTAIAFDAWGGTLVPGAELPIVIDGDPGEIRAYGDGGVPLPVQAVDGEIRIGVTAGPGLRALPNYPNPFTAATRIRFELAEPAEVQGAIYDVRGSRVATLPERNYGAGVQEWSWQARDDQGRDLPAGFYIAVIEAGGRRVSSQLIHMRP